MMRRIDNWRWCWLSCLWSLSYPRLFLDLSILDGLKYHLSGSFMSTHAGVPYNLAYWQILIHNRLLPTMIVVVYNLN
jgi:hypothetical protein